MNNLNTLSNRKRKSIQEPESDEDVSGLMKVLENKQYQIDNLENKIKTLEKDHNKLQNKDLSDTIEMIDFMSERKSKFFFKFLIIKDKSKKLSKFDLFPANKLRKSQFILNKKMANPEMKGSALFQSQAYGESNMKKSIRMRNSFLPGKRRFESSGSEFVNQMSSRIDKLLGRSYHKKNFKKRFETSGY